MRLSLSVSPPAVRRLPRGPAVEWSARLDLDLLEGGRSGLRPSLARGFLGDPFFRFYAVERGRARCRFAEGVRPLRPGHLYLLPSGTPFRYEGGHFAHTWLHFASDALSSTPSFRRAIELRPDSFAASQRELANLVASLPQATDLAAAFRAQAALRKLLLPFLARHLAAAVPPAAASGAEPWTGLLRFLDAQAERDFTLAELASRCGLGPDAFTRGFKARFGTTPKRFLILRRILRAKALLLRTRLSAREIAHRAGYPNEPFFFRTFKRHTGLTPLAYRAEGNRCL